MADVVFILKEKTEIGCSNIVFQSFRGVINEVIEMMFNYNINLTRSALADPIFAIRFLEGGNNPVILNESRNFIKKYYPSFDLNDRSKCEKRYGFIGVVKFDMNELLKFSSARVLINLEEKYVSFRNLCREYPNTPDREKSSKYFNVCPYNLERVPFNELEDLYDFVVQNEVGWLNEDKDMTYIPLRTW